MASIGNNVSLALNVEKKQSAEASSELISEGKGEFSTLYSQSMSSDKVDKQTPKQWSQTEGDKSGNKSPLTADSAIEEELVSSKSESEPQFESVSELNNESASPETASDILDLTPNNLTDSIGQLLNQLHDSANATVSVNHFFKAAQLGDLLIENSDNQFNDESGLMAAPLSFSTISVDKQATHDIGDGSSEVKLGEDQLQDQVIDLLSGLKERISDLSSSQRQELSQQIDLAMDNLVGLSEALSVDKQLLSDVLKQLQTLLSGEFINAQFVDEGLSVDGVKSNSADLGAGHKASEKKVQVNEQLMSAEKFTQATNGAKNEMMLSAAQDASKSPVVNVFNSQSNSANIGQTSSPVVHAQTVDMSDIESQATPKFQTDALLAGFATQSHKDPKQLEQALNSLIDKMLAEQPNQDQSHALSQFTSSSTADTQGDALSNLYSTASLNQLTQQRTQQIQTGPIEAQLQQPLNILRSEAAKELHDRVTFMLGLNKKEAEIRLDPPELGSMQIRVRSDAEQAQINFVVQSQQAKEALEQSLPRLREMLAEQGIQLGESSIEQHSESKDDNNDGSDAQQGKQGADSDEEIEQTSHISARIAGSRLGGVDFYA